jgi:signal transduction histidine kinase/chemotaxis methyl-accepting protein methylase/ActR/RegA family two-component response regulator
MSSISAKAELNKGPGGETDAPVNKESPESTALYALLTSEVLPKLTIAANADDIRLWIPECGNGELAYLVASACLQLQATHEHYKRAKLFATDKQDNAIRSARAGRFPPDVQRLLPPDRREVVFRRANDDCQVHPAVRAMCVFAVHDLLRSPPFSKIDMIFWGKTPAHAIPLNRIIPVFHYALKTDGLLLIEHGTSLIQDYAALFAPVDGCPNLYRRKPGSEMLPSVIAMVDCRNTTGATVLDEGLSREDMRAARDEIRYANDELRQVIEEIEERNRELSRLNDDLTNLFGNINLPLLIIGTDLKILRTNAAAERIFHLMPHDLGRSIDDMNLGIRVPRLTEMIAKVIDSDATHEQDVQDRDGHWYSMRIKPYVSAAGSTEGAVLGLVDIDAIKQSRDRERKARAEAEAANRAKDQFLAILSHELRTPLTPLMGWVKMLKSGKLDEAKRLHGLEIIERSVNAQSQLIEDLLDISRIVTGKLELKMGPADLGAVMQSAIDYVQESARTKNIQLSVHMDRINPMIGDPDRLRQVFWNLLVNAVKFTPCGGRVDIRLENLSTHAQIRVSDTGEGISADLLPHIFDRFRQGDSTITRKYSGLGIGLSIVRTVVALHNGTVRAESPGPGLGSTFIITLPVREVDQAAHDLAGDLSASGPIDGLKALVIDDHAETREFVTVTLESAGATVTTADCCAQAVKHLEKEFPDIIISDIGLPDEDGLSFIRSFRAREKEKGTRPLPAIALTAFAMASDRERALEAGFNQFLSKPASMNDLIQTIANLVRMQKL